MPRLNRVLLLLVLMAAAIGVPGRNRVLAAGKAELLWDRYGVAHIFAADRESMFYAEGWAQMEAQANLLLHLYGESRGRAAEYWGPAGLELDRWVQVNGVPERAKQWYDAQDPTFRRYWDAFARGINDYGKAHPETIDADIRVVLPVSGVDVVGHALRAVHYGYMGSMSRVDREARAARAGVSVASLETNADDDMKAGSNTWAFGPPKTTNGDAMLLINPHLDWGNTFYRYQEVHLVAPDYDLYGAPQVGMPTPAVGFNPNAGWGRTVNTIDTVDVYQLTVKNGQYMYDGGLKPFEHETKTLKVKQPDGTMKDEKLEIRRSIQGPVVYDENGLTLAMRVAGIDRPRMLEQWFKMGEARNLQQFTDALKIMSVPMWHANYADDKGHIMIVFDGLVPRRKGTHDYNYWNKVVPGDTSETMWNDYLTFDELPKDIDPPSGFHQNENEAPWLFTLPPLDPSKYAPYVAPAPSVPPTMRPLRALHMITEDPKISYEMLVAKKHSTRMELADKILPDLLKAANAAGATDASRLLEKWDRTTDTDSRGGVLFQLVVDTYMPSNINSKLRVKWDPTKPLDSAYGLADPAGALKSLEAAAAECLKRYGALDVKWGDVYRYRSGPADVPANGGAGNSGVFRTITFSKREGNKFYAAAGETIVCAIEFAATQRANCTLGYGNATQPGSPHLVDQLPLMQAKQLHPVWRTKKDVEANLEKREAF